ncbi:TonB-dependent receptor [Neotamlana laminarinivorans]|uniref:TonB-dependent receptor n=1 Tax=Neotamlana laminarinivorans TaxID=2883124 RepID=A0A9X1L110_9FLAO|nr:TonB-dependent receptor plug domain-containing protein [Tamlana laminarinivorans]MCB4798165.1 TonB-dependent receptor [Tamlana laminarinivorans]
MVKKLLFLFAIIYNINLVAQTGTINGYVIFDNNETALGTSIIIKGNAIEKLASVGVNGEFAINNLPFGNYTLNFSSLNAKSQTKNILLNSKNKTINIVLELTDYQDLKEVVVQTKTEKRKIEDKGFSVNVIETKEASLRNVQTNELLNTTVGVKLRQNGGLGSNVEYSLNGLSGNSVSIFIDGIPISMYGSSFNLNSIPPALIERIEIYKGVVPGHLADDALGGAINIVMKTGSKTNFNASISYGSFNTLQVNANGLYRDEKSGFTVKASAFYNYSDNNYKISGPTIVDIGIGGVETPITARRFYDAYKSYGSVLNLGYTDVKWADQFFIGVTGSDDYKQVQHGAFVNKIPYKGRFLESDALLANLVYLKKDFLTNGLDVNITGLFGERHRVVNDTTAVAYSWTGNRATNFRGEEYEYTWGSQSEQGPTLLNIKRQVSSVRAGVSYKINNNHKVLVNHFYSGLDREDSDEMVSLLENTFQSTSDLYKNITSLSYELNTFENKLKLNIFGKHYQQKVLNTSPEFNDDETEVLKTVYNSNKNYNGFGLAGSYAFKSTVTLLASAEKAIRLPSEIEVFGDAGDNVVANLSVKPEISKNINLGFRFGKFKINSHDFTISTNLFARNIQDLIGLPASSENSWENDELVQYANFDDKTTSKGIELQLSYNYKNNFGLNFNLSRLTLEYTNRFGNTVDIPNTPLFTINGSLRYSFKNIIQNKSRLNLYYSNYFTDEFLYLNPPGDNNTGYDEFVIPKQFIQDLGFSYIFPDKKLVLSFDAKNIFDKAAYDNRSVQKPGRAFYLKLNYTINKF